MLLSECALYGIACLSAVLMRFPAGVNQETLAANGTSHIASYVGHLAFDRHDPLSVRKTQPWEKSAAIRTADNTLGGAAVQSHPTRRETTTTFAYPAWHRSALPLRFQTSAHANPLPSAQLRPFILSGR